MTNGLGFGGLGFRVWGIGLGFLDRNLPSFPGPDPLLQAADLTSQVQAAKCSRVDWVTCYGARYGRSLRIMGKTQWKLGI